MAELKLGAFVLVPLFCFAPQFSYLYGARPPAYSCLLSLRTFGCFYYKVTGLQN